MTTTELKPLNWKNRKHTSADVSESTAPDRVAGPEWRNSGNVCALSDGERHIGHIVKIAGRWHAFDAMHCNDTGDGFRVVGTFATADAAREAVEQSYYPEPVMFAGAA